MCIIAYGPACARNKAEGTVSLPNGAVITFTNIGDDASYAKLQGRTFTGSTPTRWETIRPSPSSSCSSPARTFGCHTESG